VSGIDHSPRARDFSLSLWQVRYELRAFSRNRARALFTFIFPLMFLVIFASLFKGAHIARRGGIPYDDFFVPGILAYGVISTTFVNMAISTSILRDEGILKRMQGTPMPRWAYVAGRIGATIVIVAAMSVVTLALGSIIWDVHVRASTLPAVIATMLLGTAAFTTLGIGIVRFIPSAEAAPAIVNFTVLPLTFISGIWFVTDTMPSWLQNIAKIFPLRALADALQHAFDPLTPGAGFRSSDMVTLAIWLAVGIYLMLRFLNTPQGDS
jgi:ABC-2 type transport system permease protein